MAYRLIYQKLIYIKDRSPLRLRKRISGVRYINDIYIYRKDFILIIFSLEQVYNCYETFYIIAPRYL